MENGNLARPKEMIWFGTGCSIKGIPQRSEYWDPLDRIDKWNNGVSSEKDLNIGTRGTTTFGVSFEKDA
jgi:hypothetical protein